MIFLLLGLVHMILLRWASPSVGLLIATDILAFLTVIYAGFVLAYVNSLQLWNSALLPVLFTVAGLWGGVGLTLAIVLATGATVAVASLAIWIRLFLIGFIIILIVYLLSIRYTGVGARASIKEIVAGRWAPLFWVMIVALGMALPLAVALMAWVGGLAIPVALLYVVILFQLLGDLSLRYCILKCAYYQPLIPSTSYAT